MTIQKKSLISTLNTTKKAIVASTPAVSGVSSDEVRNSARMPARLPARLPARMPLRKAARNSSRKPLRKA